MASPKGQRNLSALDPRLLHAACPSRERRCLPSNRMAGGGLAGSAVSPQPGFATAGAQSVSALPSPCATPRRGRNFDATHPLSPPGRVSPLPLLC